MLQNMPSLRLNLQKRALEILERYNWPGNVRELENVVQRAIIMSEDSIDIEQLPDYLKYPTPNFKTHLKIIKTGRKRAYFKNNG